jgi:hypothetical protein
MSEVVPFGKYKGQPIEVLANDRGYLDWLTAQSWFRERYAGIYTLIINNFGEPSEGASVEFSPACAIALASRRLAAASPRLS